MCKLCRFSARDSRLFNNKEEETTRWREKKGKMTLIEETVKGYEAFKEKIEEVKNTHDRIFVVFTGSKENNNTRLSWCSDCNDFYTVFMSFKMKHQLEGYLLYVDVGERAYWKDKACPFRTDPALKLTSVPTLMEWGTPKRLSDEMILKESALEMVFLEED